MYKPAPAQPIITIKNITAAYKTDIVLDDISCHIPAGVMCAIVGPNGAGKSTLLNILVGLHTTHQGQIQFDQNKINNRSCIAYVPQKSLVDWDFPATVYDVVMMGRYPSRGFFQRMTNDDHDIVMQALSAVGMHQLRTQPIGQLSGGQQQRVFFARALAQKAQIYFLDEPFAGVDITTENDLIQLLKNEVRQGKTVVMVHHDLNTLADYFDYLILLNKKIISYGSVESTFIKNNIIKAYGRAPLCMQ